MTRRFGVAIVSLAVTLLSVTPAKAIVGAGFHWGFDLSMNMEDSYNNYIAIDAFQPATLISSSTISQQISSNLGISSDSLLSLLGGSPILTGQLPFSISRSGFERHAINFGGKVFIDIVPVLDAIELSCNFGMWQYNGVIHYPKGLNPALTLNDLQNPSAMTYDKLLDMSDSIPLTLEEYGMSYFGLSKTPYAKLHFDLSIRKNLITVPKRMKILRIYAGGGPSLHMQTPVLTPALVEEVIGESIEGAGGDLSNLATLMQDQTMMKKVVEKIISGFSVPKFGMHLMAGTMVKLPVIPVGFYVDGKYMIPFGAMDEEAKLSGFGFLVNAGVTLGL